MVLKISFASRDDFVKEWEKNIAKGGVFVKTAENPPARSRVTVSVEMAFKELSFELEGEAVHVAPAGVGVQLDPIPNEIKEDIKKILAEEDKLELVEDEVDEIVEDAIVAATDDDDDWEESEPELVLVDDDEAAPVPPKAGPATAESATAGPAQDGTAPAPLEQASSDKISKMSRNEKMAQARKGGQDARAILMRDRDPQVVMNVLLNPRITIAEVISLAGSGSLKLDLIKYIVGKPEWMANEAVVLNIVLNPKTPTPTAVGLLPKLSEKNVRMIAKRPVKQQIKGAALKLIVK